jgi:hypothetical protein
MTRLSDLIRELEEIHRTFGDMDVLVSQLRVSCGEDDDYEVANRKAVARWSPARVELRNHPASILATHVRVLTICG